MIDIFNIDDVLFFGIDGNWFLFFLIVVYFLKILILYGLLCICSFLRLVVEEVVRILIWFGVEVCFFNFFGFLLVDDGVDVIYLKVWELCNFVFWCEGMVWLLLECYGIMIGLMKM